MNIIYAPAGTISAKRPQQGLKDIKTSGFKDVLFDGTIYINHRTVEENIDFENMIKPYIEAIRKNDLRTTVARAPFFYDKISDYSNLVECIKKFIEKCVELGCKYIIVRPLQSLSKDISEWEINHRFYMELAEKVKINNVMILLENCYRNINGHLVRGVCSDGKIVSEWIKKLNGELKEERFGFCMDVGTCNLCGQNMYDFAISVKECLKTVILRDCDGNRNNAMLPFTCVNGGKSQTDWLNFFRGMREIDFDGELVINCMGQASALSPILKPAILNFAKNIAEYCKWQIEIENLVKKYPSRVLFGAGNMCRNYMKNYGEKFPPLFTCDNNSKLWGTSFCGMEVKNPEELRKLPEDCAIFICNIYYREIEEQLRKMGISNTIEYFSDDYMPTFYFEKMVMEDK